MAGNHDPRDLESRNPGDQTRDPEHWSVALSPDAGSPHTGSLRDAREAADARHSQDPTRGGSRDDDIRGAFRRELNLPRSDDRELVRDRARQFRLNGADVQTLSTVGAFRVVSEADLSGTLERHYGRGDSLRHLEQQGLIERVPLDGDRRAVALTEPGRDLLERHREPETQRYQAFYSGANRPRERSHDVEVYRAYLKAAERLNDRGARIERVQLDRELKREYQRFLQERNRGDRDSDGRPDRSRAEIEAWAREHNLPYFDEQVHFPDVRIEYEDANGDIHYEDIEVVTEHYRGAHWASAARCGFSMHVSRRAGGGAFDPRVAEDFV